MNKIIAISGPPGAGKSTLMRELSDHMSGVCLDYDCYQRITDRPIHELVDWIRKGANYNEFEIPELAQNLLDLKQDQPIIESVTGSKIKPGPLIFFETPLGREHWESGQHIDILIWIDIPFDIALARILKARTGFFLKDQRPEEHTDNIAWLDEYLANYLADVRHLLYMQKERVRVNADIVVDGTNNIESMTEYTMKEILKR